MGKQLQPRRLPERVPGSFLLQQLQTFPSTSQTPRTTVKMAVSKIRQNYHEDCEALINKQINMEFYASYVYLSMSSYFNRDDQALHGFAEHFKKESGEERAHGMKLMEYQTKRGGRVVFQDVAKPTTMDWGTPIEAMEAALELEKTVNQKLAPSQRRQLLGRAFRFRSRRRRSGRSHLRRPCQRACSHRAGFHARGSRAPNRSFQSGL